MKLHWSLFSKIQFYNKLPLVNVMAWCHKHGWKFSVSRRNSVTAIPSGTIPVIRAEPLRKVLGYNKGGGGGGGGVCSQGEAWLAVHKGCKQTLPAFNYNKLLIGFGSAVLIGVKTNWSPIIACPDLTRSSRDQSINKASLVAIMVMAVALVDVSGGRTTWWRTEACCQKSWMCWMQFSEGYWIICLH